MALESKVPFFFSNNLLQWYSIYRPYEPQAWLLLLAVMLFMGGNCDLELKKIERFCLSGPVLGVVRICGRKEDQQQSVILNNSFLDTFKINLGISISPVYDPDIKKLFILLVD